MAVPDAEGEVVLGYNVVGVGSAGLATDSEEAYKAVGVARCVLCDVTLQASLGGIVEAIDAY